MSALRQPDPRPPKRKRGDKSEWEALRSRFAHLCCVACGGNGNCELHHVCPRSQGGDDVEANLVVLCRTCHTRFEGHEPNWRHVSASIRNHIYSQPERVAYVLEKLGQDRFDRRYPPLNKQCARVVYRDFGNWLPCNRQSGHRGDCEAA